jgi:uncharacterized protein
MNAPAVLLATAKVRPGCEAAFMAWQARHQEVISKFPGFLSSDIMPPGSANDEEWTIVINFQTPDQLQIWQRSPERAQVIAESIPFLEGGNLGEVLPEARVAHRPETVVTEVILSQIKPGMDAQYREWSTRIQHAQAQYPGYQGMYLQPPTSEGGRWTTLIRYDTAEHLAAWMAAPEREKLLNESKAFIEHEELSQLATSFPGWVPIDPQTGKGPPNWKTSLLVLLGLFPIVMLEMKFLSPILAALGLHASPATFVGNTISVFLTSFATMPLFIIWFGWWLFPKRDLPATTLKGCLILAVLFALEVAVLWKLLPW